MVQFIVENNLLHNAPINEKPPPTPGRAEVRVGGDLQMVDDKLPNYESPIIMPEITSVWKSMEVLKMSLPWGQVQVTNPHLLPDLA